MTEFSRTQQQIPFALSGNVPKEYLRTADHQLLPPRVGHNWNDQAFRKNQDKVQQLEGEWRGKRWFESDGNFANPMPEDLCDTAQQLILAMSRKNRSRKGLSAVAEKRYVTLDDKILRFNAFLNEKAPDGAANEFWHRKFVIDFYPADDTILIQEPPIMNSGLDGGTFLKRQRVATDPRQKEEFPEDDFLTLNFFNVGQTVRINAHEFFLYDCDAFTREFLTAIGVNVGEAIEYPDDFFMSTIERAKQKMRSNKFGILDQDPEEAQAEQAARFVRDGGKVLRFYGLLDERGKTPGGIVRKLEVFMFVEDGAVAIVERQSTAEASPGLFLSRSFLPKKGTIAKANELTFSHRVNGQRAAYMGEDDSYYQDTDLDVGVTINVFGRSVYLYNCDGYTRSFYEERYGITLRPAIDVTDYFAGQSQKKVASSVSDQQRTLAAMSPQAQQAALARRIGFQNVEKEQLRFRLMLARPKTHDDAHRRFTLTFYTDTNEGMVFENEVLNGGRNGGCIVRRQPLQKPTVPSVPRNAPGYDPEPVKQYYGLADVGVGKELMIAGMQMIVTDMDAHTKAYFEGNLKSTSSEERIDNLLEALLEYLGSRYGTAKKAYLAFDHDKDGVVSLAEFTEALREFQITEDAVDAKRLFDRISSSTDTAYLTTEDIMKWMGELKSEGSRRAKANVEGEAAQSRDIADRALRVRTLRDMRQRMEAKCANSAAMFRLVSVMPRAYKGARADVSSLTNPRRDAIITPVQLRRCTEEVLGCVFTEEQMHCVLHFFFPDMPEDQHFRQRDDLPDYTVNLPQFQQLYKEMLCLTTMLPDDRAPEEAIKTSVI